MKEKNPVTVWISDVHLGNPNCQYDKLYDFLKSLEDENGKYIIERLFLVGDIIDMTGFNHKVFWSKHRKIIKKFFRMADKGVQITYIRGNHDYFLSEEFLKESPEGVNFNGIQIKYNCNYTTANGKRFFILHGDEFDGLVRMYPIIYTLGDYSYALIIFLNRLQNKIRRFFGMKEWSLAQWIKKSVKRSIQYINNYESLVVGCAKEHQVDGVICGHIHNAEDKVIDDIRYLNCGCWVEFCSYLYEDENGDIRLVCYD